MRKYPLTFGALMLLWAGSAFAQVPSITLDWTAPGDDSTTGTASVYEMRYKNSAPTDTTQAAILTWWNTATVVPGLPVPLLAGTSQTVTVAPIGGFAPGTWYFYLRAADEVPNWSAFSNRAQKVVVDALPPNRVTDLRVR